MVSFCMSLILKDIKEVSAVLILDRKVGTMG